jgi:hypothetical protein
LKVIALQHQLTNCRFIGLLKLSRAQQFQFPLTRLWQLDGMVGSVLI